MNNKRITEREKQLKVEKMANKIIKIKRIVSIDDSK